MKTQIAVTFILFLLLFTGVGIFSATKKQNTVTDYLLANRSVNPWLVALSAMATGQSGLFGWNDELGIIIGAVIVAIYCFSGGIRASIWTDTVQAIIMIASLVILATVALLHCGGFNGLWTSLNTIDPSLIDFSPPERQFGVIPFFIGWIVAGFGVVGQPHIIIRAMSINSADKLGFTRNLKTCCGLINSLSATLIGLTARVLLPDLLTNGDPEMALPELSLSLLPAFMGGLMLAGMTVYGVSLLFKGRRNHKMMS